MDPHWQRGSRATRCRYSLHCRNLPATQRCGRDYLGSVLPGLANFPINRIAELTPAAWAARI